MFIAVYIFKAQSHDSSSVVRFKTASKSLVYLLKNGSGIGRIPELFHQVLGDMQKIVLLVSSNRVPPDWKKGKKLTPVSEIFLYFLYIQFTLLQTQNLQSPGTYISKRNWDPSQKAITK